MATTLQTIIDRTRLRLIESAANYWSDTELLAIINDGIRDLWRAINDNYQDYFLTVDATNVYLAANGTTLTGVPSDVSIVRGIEARDLTAFPYVRFEFRPWGHRDFITAREQGSLSADQVRLFFFCITDAGSPVGTPVIRVAPAITTQLNLTLSYVPTIATLAATGNNPIPGESDAALVAWTVAYARAKEREDRGPDPGWLSIYATEKNNILVSLTPRQTQDEELAEALFEPYW